MGRSSREHIDQRQRDILCYLSSRPSLTIAELAAQAGASSMTVRRDVNRLIEQKAVLRVAPGRFSLQHEAAAYEPPASPSSVCRAEKAAIARAAIDLISDGDIVGMDASSTTLELGKLLLRKNDITLVTNNLFLPCCLMRHPSLRLHCIGGQVLLSNNSTQGASACAEIIRYNYDCVFFSATALDFSSGLSDAEQECVGSKLAFLVNAARRILLIDSTKLGQKTFCNFLPLSEVSMIVTDDGATPEQLDSLEKLRIPYRVARMRGAQQG